MLDAAVVVAVFAGGAAAARPAPVEAELADDLQGKLEQWLAFHRAPGVVAAIRPPDGSRWIGTSGTVTVGKNDNEIRPSTAILDRLLHHATVINIKGQSYRMRAHVLSALEGSGIFG